MAFDARHNVWLISSLGIRSNGTTQVVTSRSTNGGVSWSEPGGHQYQRQTRTRTGRLRQHQPSSPFYGNCYTEWDNTADGNRIKMQPSSNGGLTWGPARNSGDNATGIGGQPVVRPNGTVLVPMARQPAQIRSFRSIDGGAPGGRRCSWPASVATPWPAASAQPLPSAEMDAAGTAYVVWQDCRFRSGCTANDIVLASRPARPPGGRSPGPDRRHLQHRRSLHPRHRCRPPHPGIGARVGLPTTLSDRRLHPSPCRLNVGFISSTNGGASWSAPPTWPGL